MPCLSCVILEPNRFLGSIAAGASRLVRKLALAVAIRAERRALMSLDEAALKDMGFNKGQAAGEYGRSFWDVPADRLHS